MHGTNIVERGLIVLIFGAFCYFFVVFSVVPPLRGNFFAEALICSGAGRKNIGVVIENDVIFNDVIITSGIAWYPAPGGKKYIARPSLQKTFSIAGARAFKVEQPNLKVGGLRI